ncbi:MAG: hypothetical protein HYU29_08490 [Chloroflexi bacterium]|nr:hypothetical protein [Chloroflexota bacterium]
MAGLDASYVDAFDKSRALGRILHDLETDFVYAPHYHLLYAMLPDDLWALAIEKLKSGQYQPSSLITAEIPKPSGLTRPGSILTPIDRIIYQAVADLIADNLDSDLDGARVFSYRLIRPDDSNIMFRPRPETYEEYREAMATAASKSSFALRTDIASYFFHVNHHTLENLLTSAGVPDGVIRLLVKTMLEAWSGRFSHGLPQGMFPSDLLGNYYLSTFDTYAASRGIPSVRYVDDIVMFFNEEFAARSSLAPLTRFLRTIGLDPNEAKTSIVTSEKAVHEETELDRLFETAREEVLIEIEEGIAAFGYGFQSPWEDDPETTEAAESQALNRLWEARPIEKGEKRDQLDRFCLTAYGRLGSDAIISDVLAELGHRPHMTRTYCAYLSKFARGRDDVRGALQEMLKSKTAYDSELQWPIAALLSASSNPPSSVSDALNILTDLRRSEELRALCAIFVGKFGNAASRTVLRGHWDSEPAQHVKAAMIYSLLFFGKEERHVLLTYWGQQGEIFALLAKAVRKAVSEKSPA